MYFGYENWRTYYSITSFIQLLMRSILQNWNSTTNPIPKIPIYDVTMTLKRFLQSFLHLRITDHLWRMSRVSIVAYLVREKFNENRTSNRSRWRIFLRAIANWEHKHSTSSSTLTRWHFTTQRNHTTCIYWLHIKDRTSRLCKWKQTQQRNYDLSHLVALFIL